MTQLLDLLTQQLGQGRLQQLGQAVGASEEETGKAVSAALPLLMTALAHNAQDTEGAASLHRALQRDHDGSVLDDLQAFMDRGGDTHHGDGILRHALGDRRDQVAAGVSQAAGVHPQTVNRLLPMLAPLVMGALGRKQRETGASATGLARLLAAEHQSLEQQHPEVRGLVGLLDRDGDGRVVDDLTAAGKGLLGRLFKG